MLHLTPHSLVGLFVYLRGLFYLLDTVQFEYLLLGQEISYSFFHLCKIIDLLLQRVILFINFYSDRNVDRLLLFCYYRLSFEG